MDCNGRHAMCEHPSVARGATRCEPAAARARVNGKAVSSEAVKRSSMIFDVADFDVSRVRRAGRPSAPESGVPVACGEEGMPVGRCGCTPPVDDDDVPDDAVLGSSGEGGGTSTAIALVLRALVFRPAESAVLRVAVEGVAVRSPADVRPEGFSCAVGRYFVRGSAASFPAP